MAKRYYQSAKSRSDESRGMKRYERDRKRDKGMISADDSAPSSMPQQVMMKEYPQVPYMDQGGYIDTIYGVDYEIGQAVNSKYVKKSRQ